MYYELYLDVLFLINMFMDLLLLFLVKKISKASTTHFRILMGSILGAAGTCILVILPMQIPVLVTYAVHILVGFLMVRVGCNIKSFRPLVKSVVMLYVVSFLMAGIFQAFAYYVNMNHLIYRVFVEENDQAVKLRMFLLISGISYILITLLVRFYEDYRNRFSNMYEITLYHKGKSKRVTGFLDTGNQLKDPLTARPVSVADVDILRHLLEDGAMKQVERMMDFDTKEEIKPEPFLNVHYIPYHSVGKEQGVLASVTIDIMSIRCKGESIVVRNPILAVSRVPVSAKGEYQIILNPILLEQP